MRNENLTAKLSIPDDKRALEIFKCIRWVDGVYCPECKSFDTYKRGYLNKTKVRRYSCKKCGKNFTDFTGTVFANKNLPLGEMFYIIANLDKKSIKRLSEELGHKWESVYRLSKDFKECLAKKTRDPVLSGEIEIDEMYQSTGQKGVKKKNQEQEDLN